MVYHCHPHAGLVDPGVPGLRMSPAKMFERRMALRISREQAALELPSPDTATLASVRTALGATPPAEQPDPSQPEVEMSDDDAADLEDLAVEDDFYADALEDV